MMNMKEGTSYLLVEGKKILFIVELKLVNPVGMEMIHLGIIELVEVNLGIGIQMGIIQAGMTNWEIVS